MYNNDKSMIFQNKSFEIWMMISQLIGKVGSVYKI
jgi:hypothetical protein